MGAGLVLSGEENADLIAAHNYLKGGFAASGARFFPAMADKIARATYRASEMQAGH